MPVLAGFPPGGRRRPLQHPERLADLDGRSGTRSEAVGAARAKSGRRMVGFTPRHAHSGVADVGAVHVIDVVPPVSPGSPHLAGDRTRLVY